MLFVPINVPVILIFFIHDMDLIQKGVSATQSIVVDSKTGTRLIIDDIYIWDSSFEDFLSILNANWMSVYIKISHFLGRNASSVQREFNL